MFDFVSIQSGSLCVSVFCVHARVGACVCLQVFLWMFGLRYACVACVCVCMSSN